MPAPVARLVEDLERELKFVLPAGRGPAARAFLETICEPDPGYPRALVWTVYFDTRSTRSLGEKFDSDYLKMKIRVRWYGRPGEPVSGPVFAEAKYRVGTRRQKVRVKLAVDASEVHALDLDDARLASLARALEAEGVPVGPQWRPVLRLRYERSRFIERATRARVSIDLDITPEAVSRGLVGSFQPGPLPVAVVEVKGREDTLPRALRPLLHLGARQGSLSKFAAVYMHARRIA